MSEKIKVSILGVTGYAGLELLRYLRNHPQVRINQLVSFTQMGQRISEIYPHLEGLCDLLLEEFDVKKIVRENDLVILALPHKESQKIVPELIDKVKIIDLSGDFRLNKPFEYRKYYHKVHECPKLLTEFVYGLPEQCKEEIKLAQNIANPGCFAIASDLALLPLQAMIDEVDLLSITGSTGSGKSPSSTTHHPVRSRNLKSYKIGEHQHIPEIAQVLDLKESQLNFIPSSGPFARGIHLTAIIKLKYSLENDLKYLYEEYYKKAPFVRIKEQVQLVDVVGSNFADISVTGLNGKLVVQAVIDNLIKGASGNAIENLNLMFDLPQETAINNLYPLFV